MVELGSGQSMFLVRAVRDCTDHFAKANETKPNDLGGLRDCLTIQGDSVPSNLAVEKNLYLPPTPAQPATAVAANLGSHRLRSAFAPQTQPHTRSRRRRQSPSKEHLSGSGSIGLAACDQSLRRR